jgi:hypothetical protein
MTTGDALKKIKIITYKGRVLTLGDSTPPEVCEKLLADFVSIADEEEDKRLISFGHYLLSEERESSFRETNNINPKALPYEERFRFVHDADVCNWKELQKSGENIGLTN